ncbi:hypothetical protein CC85DRAFT_325296 [Cutaneotrichosporon oleaginosum]|uniref:Uncharacterized protein n=1 Tax=Cutaneotrichosporon oleaginosum TaxID=879819 RepID=A0A0J1BDB5_9TREE|nr:uncharacterized protein CC85DRAFT_325296 [Cutaneotrichosporon oleaginosum]KLT46044.1 hypothetical protein CC85DRAFT_325296 [Cutaneotrichosporon oleaginosum]TXT06737.1 hypothetical protein COLE_06068 [Cutaneotrichosporon oleaginosum]
MTCSPSPCPRHPPRPPKPPPPPLLAWRWPIGGPITDFGHEGDAGPSRVHSECSCSGIEPKPTAETEDGSTRRPTRQPRRRRRTRLVAAATSALALFSIPSVVAGPVPTPTTGSLSPTSPPTVQDVEPRSIRTLPIYTVLTVPDYGPSAVPETVLPMYFTKSSDGYWYKVEEAWSLYGRVASDPHNNPTPTVAAHSYVVTSQMPPGWGNKSGRSDFYNTPMIVAASVILGILIVFAIIVITYQRRKEARRKKRHAARMRRKALAAAGLTEDGLKGADSVLEAEFKKRLDELELAHATKRREKRAQKNQPSAFVRTKVRVWRSNIRRRKSPRSSHDDEDHRVKDQWSTHGENRSQTRPDSPGSLLTRDSASFMTDSSRAPSPHRSFSRAGLEVQSNTEQGTGSDTLAETAHSATSGGMSGDASGEALSPSTSAQDPTASSASLPSPAAAPGPSGHMPPAYRPASVRSLDMNAAGPSTSRAVEPTAPNVLSPEKASAAGYYPAPATADAEQAQEVARRADAKAPIVIPPEEEERRAMHVATDDKRELERLRLGASAPPVTRIEDEDGAGPSAPNFEVDGEGFEMLTAASGSGDETDARSDAGATNTTSGFGSASSRLTVPGLPAPPPAATLRSLRTFMDDDTHLRPSAPTSPTHLRPSAPPSPVRLRSSASSPVPSAPPLEPSAPPLSPSAPPLEPSAPVPSAPPLDDFEDEDEPSAPPLDDESTHMGSVRVSSDVPHSEGEEPLPTPEADADMGDVNASLRVGGHGFLPRYEP